MRKMGDIQPKRHYPKKVILPPTEDLSLHLPKPYIPEPTPERRAAISFKRSEPKSIRPYLWVLLSLCVGLGIFFLIERLGTVSISFLPLQKTVTIDVTATLSRDNGLNILPYEVMSVEDSVEYTPLGGTVAPTNAPVRVQGSVRIFNTYSTSPVKLAKGTVFVSTQTKTSFTLDTDVVVPGYKKSGTTRLPGSVDGMVTTPEPITMETLTPQDFTLPSYAKLPESTRIYARSLATLTPITGEDPTTTLRIDTEQEARLKTELIEHLRKELPSGYTFFESITAFENVRTEQVSFDPLKPQNHKQKISGKISTFIFKQEDINDYLISHGEMDPFFKKQDSHATLEIVKQSITATAPIKDILTTGVGEMAITGDFVVKKAFEPAFVCDNLATLSLKELNTLTPSHPVLAPYIEQVQVHIFPPWLFTKPSPKRFHCGFMK